MPDLCFYFRSVLKSEPHIVFIINSSVVHKAAPQLFVKFGKQVILFAKGVEEGVNRTESCLLTTNVKLDGGCLQVFMQKLMVFFGNQLP